MSELKLVSPLLDQMSVEEEIAGHNGCTCYALRHVQSGERFVVKRISVPASDLQVRALILSGAYPDDAAVHAYYGSVAEDIKNELDTGMRLAENGYFAGASSYQIEPKESGIGYDVYILYPRMVSLRAFLDHSAMTGLRAVNLGIDLCDALTACRDAGYLFENLKPENVFLTQSGRFLARGPRPCAAGGPAVCLGAGELPRPVFRAGAFRHHGVPKPHDRPVCRRHAALPHL